MSERATNLPPRPVPVVHAYCPKCGSAMRLIEVGQGNTFESFYGCTDYPVCTGKRAIRNGEAMLTDDEVLSWI